MDETSLKYSFDDDFKIVIVKTYSIFNITNWLINLKKNKNNNNNNNNNLFRYWCHCRTQHFHYSSND